MRVFYSPNHTIHSPQTFISRGQLKNNPEQPKRAEILEASARAAGHNLIESQDHGTKPIEAIHDKGYMNFLKNSWSLWQNLPDSSNEVIPNIHPGRNMSLLPKSLIGLAGYYQADTACPIGKGTYDGAILSANVAVSGALALIEDAKNSKKNTFAYSLCRPPGHHAFSDQAGGFCFFNNTAIAGQCFIENRVKKIAILDIDVHHGNGTQSIFYNRSDVLTVSLHGDPSDYYPFFSGYSDEAGLAMGKGYNINLPLEKNTADQSYLDTLNFAIDEIITFKPEILIIALGLDISESDPLAFMRITTDGFYRIGQAIGRIKLPTLMIQEGGYISDILGDNLIAILGGFEETHHN